jgi:hypothetical protein
VHHVRLGLALLSARVSNPRRRNLELPVGAEPTRETKGSRSRTGSAFSPILATSPSIVGAASTLSVLHGVLTPP